MAPSAIINAPIAVSPPPSPALRAMFSDSAPLKRNTAPPMIIKIPVTIIIIPKPFDGSLLDKKKAAIDKMIGGVPKPIPRVIASNGNKPSPAPPPPHASSAP